MVFVFHSSSLTRAVKWRRLRHKQVQQVFMALPAHRVNKWRMGRFQFRLFLFCASPRLGLFILHHECPDVGNSGKAASSGKPVETDRNQRRRSETSRRTHMKEALLSENHRVNVWRRRRIVNLTSPCRPHDRKWKLTLKDPNSQL